MCVGVEGGRGGGGAEAREGAKEIVALCNYVRAIIRAVHIGIKENPPVS